MIDLSILSTRPLFFDGATGTMLPKFGLSADKLGETFNVERPNTILRLHKSYLKAGADVIKTNTFSANRLKEKAIGYPTETVVANAASLARRAVEESGKGYVALDVGPLGVLLEPSGDMKFEEAVDTFKVTIGAGAKYADLILIETMGDVYEMKAAIIAAKETCDLPIFVTATFGLDGKLLCGADAECFAAFAEGIGVSALGINCGYGPDEALDVIKKLARVTSVPIIANPNAGLPEVFDGETKYSVTPDDFGQAMARLVEAGAQIIGGCCGTTPEHISSAVAVCSQIRPVKLTDKRVCAVTSYAKTVYLGGRPIIIGERINPTGKARLKSALKKGDIEYVLSEGLSQESAGADILDVNVGVPDTDESVMIKKVVKALQKISRTPLELDSSDPKALETALRAYNGKPMINSVNGSKQSLLSVLPLAKKYGGVLVALTLDDKGIPETVEGRLKIASRIIRVAEAYGISRKNLVFDTLTMTVATDRNAAMITLEAMEKIRENFGVNTVLGVSNISFGLPERDVFNAAFYTTAVSRGLSAAIVNPLSDGIRKARLSYDALTGHDKNCEKYIAYVSGKDVAKTADTLHDAIAMGLETKAAELAEKLLEESKPEDVINNEIIPTLNAVGKDFEEKKIYLPELLVAASASEAAFEKIKAVMNKNGAAGEPKGKIALATVKGDIHDLGKNIVKAMLSNYGYEVIDMGKDVAPEAIAELVTKEELKLVGLSALMTTTLGAMADTVKAVKAVRPECRVMVGGAVVTEEFANSIGADYYGKDAVNSVRIAEEVFGK